VWLFNKKNIAFNINKFIEHFRISLILVWIIKLNRRIISISKKFKNIRWRNFENSIIRLVFKNELYIFTSYSKKSWASILKIFCSKCFFSVFNYIFYVGFMCCKYNTSCSNKSKISKKTIKISCCSI